MEEGPPRREADRLRVEVAFPTRFQYSVLRVEIAHSLYPEEVREDAIRWMTEKVAELMAQQLPRVEEILARVGRK